MTGPAVQQADTPAAYPVSVTLDDMAAQNVAAGEPTKPAELKLTGDAVPEEFRGKTLAEVLEFQAATKRAFIASEEARKEANARADRIMAESSRPAQVTAPPADVPKKLTRDELKTLHATDPIAAMEYMASGMASSLIDNFEKRTAGLATSGQTIAEQNARAKYPDEFALFGDDIKNTVDKEIVDKSLLADPKNWDRIIAYERGKPGNFEKLVEKRSQASSQRAAETARAEQAANSGASMTGVQTRTSAPSGKLDALEQEIARGFNMDEAEYLKWKGMR